MISIFGKKFFEKKPALSEHVAQRLVLSSHAVRAGETISMEDARKAVADAAKNEIGGLASLFKNGPTSFADKTANNVASRLAPAVQYFVERRLASSDPTFTTAQLLHYVRDAVGRVAPGSPERILRMLRQAGKINYRVISRKLSEYEATDVIPDVATIGYEDNSEPQEKWVVEVNTGDGWTPSINVGLIGKGFSSEKEASDAMVEYGTKKTMLGLKYRAIKQGEQQ